MIEKKKSSPSNITVSFLIWLCFFFVSAQELPPIKTYLPDEYGAETQNWSITQSENKYICIANNKGLLEFDGARWRQYPSPNGTIIRSIQSVDKRIYCGSYMEFGFWLRNGLGELEYQSISQSISEQLIPDEQFWNIEYVNDRVLFQSLNRIYIYDTNTEKIKIINSDIAIISMFKVDQDIYFQEVQKGVFKINKGEPELLIDIYSEIDNQIKVVNISKKENGLLLLTNNRGFYLFKNQKLTKWQTSSNDILNKISIYDSAILNDGSFALGTISNGLLLLNPEGTLKFKINQNNGLGNNTVLSIFEDSDQNIWLGLDNGVNCINMNSPVQIYQDHLGNIGTVYAAEKFGDFLYLGTNQGLFYKKLDSKDPFQLIGGTKGQVWNLFTYDNTLFCGHDSGTFIVKNDQIEVLSTLTGVWNFRKIPKKPDLLMQGTYAGLGILEKKNGNWSFRNEISNFNYSSRFLELYANKAWINHEYKGVFKIEIDENYEKVTKIIKVPNSSKSKNSSIITFNNELLYADKNGIFLYDTISDSFKKDSLLSTLYTETEYTSGKLIDDQNGKLWNFTTDHLSYITDSKFSDQYEIKRIPIPSTLRREMVGYENIIYIDRSKYLIGRTNGYLMLNLEKIEPKDQTILLNQILVKSKAGNFTPIRLKSDDQTFKSNLNNIYFQYSIPEYSKYILPEFQYKLEGFYDNWSEWSTKNEALFENLPPGSYNFLVRSKMGNNYADNQISYAFEIEYPFFQSKLAVAIYVISLIILLLFINRAYRKYYHKQQRKIIEENEKQMNLKQLESQGEIMKLNNEKLKQDIENKNKELATSTMNIIKKNEILNAIKKELQDISGGNYNFNSVERIIDQNLNDQDDWKNFEQAFKNIDKEFLRTLKSKHPELTPNDLRFCTYLRLNLSSKEIAPLLNISVRSVEIKRYRLRKKLNLEHSQNLVNYILEI